ncbi:MAG: translation initiation factor IF-3 [Cyanobacteria bacterium HKST-UBA06]|nr:translation initiation factor IF-3 [Cyanobacteria bacterium HKST-UBA06]
MKNRSRFPTTRPQDKGPQLLTDRIKADEVRLIVDDENRGVVSRQEAERIAEEQGLDLIVMSLDSSPPVVRVMDYGRFKFERDKKAKEARKNQHNVEVKEVKMTVRIDKHDYDVKLSRSRKFLEQGHKVKLSIRLKGREMQHANLAHALAKRFVEHLGSEAEAEAMPKMEGRQVIVIVAPGKGIKVQAQSQAQAQAQAQSQSQPQSSTKPAAKPAPAASDDTDDTDHLPVIVPTEALVVVETEAPADATTAITPTTASTDTAADTAADDTPAEAVESAQEAEDKPAPAKKAPAAKAAAAKPAAKPAAKKPATASTASKASASKPKAE